MKRVPPDKIGQRKSRTARHIEPAPISRLDIDGLFVEVERKCIKNMYLRVLPPDGRIRLNAPLKAPKESLARFVQANLAWLRKKQWEIKERRERNELAYVTGETVAVWGEPHELIVLHTEELTTVFLKERQLVLLTPESSSRAEREAVLNEWYRRQLFRALDIFAPRAENIVGQCAAEYRIKNMKTRWGTCNVVKRRVWVNLQLAKKPRLCLEYILIHELTHLWEPSHNARFKSFMDKFCPDWRIRKKLLNNS